jgi:hypothetical protein
MGSGGGALQVYDSEYEKASKLHWQTELQCQLGSQSVVLLKRCSEQCPNMMKRLPRADAANIVPHVMAQPSAPAVAVARR